jgi:hypothetical protein
VFRRSALIVLGAALALSASACAPANGPAKAPAPQKESTVVAAGASVTGKALPEGFPSDVPLWPGSEVTNATSAPSGGSTQYTVDFETADSYADVVDGTLRGLKTAGWEITAQEDMSSDIASAGLVAFTKDGVEVVDTLGAAGKRTTISLVVTVGK